MGDEYHPDRRRAGRAAYSITAVVYLRDERFTARVLNLSASGLLIIPPVDAAPGTLVRLNLTLPGLDQIIDVQGVVAREELVEGYRAWGVEFHGTARETAGLLETYVEWARERQLAEEARAEVARGMALVPTLTGPGHELRLPAENARAEETRRDPLSRRLTDPGLTPTPVELEEPDLLAELRVRYEATLERLDPDAAREGTPRRRLPWLKRHRAD